jgi:hypothetical protein
MSSSEAKFTRHLAGQDCGRPARTVHQRPSACAHGRCDRHSVGHSVVSVRRGDRLLAKYAQAVGDGRSLGLRSRYRVVSRSGQHWWSAHRGSGHGGRPVASAERQPGCCQRQVIATSEVYERQAGSAERDGVSEERTRRRPSLRTCQGQRWLLLAVHVARWPCWAICAWGEHGGQVRALRRAPAASITSTCWLRTGR